MSTELDKEILIGLGKDIQDLNKCMQELSKLVTSIDARIEERNTSATEWRNELCRKLEDMRKFCLSRQLDKGKMWFAIICSFLVPLLVGGMVFSKFMTLVDIHGDRLNIIEAQHRHELK